MKFVSSLCVVGFWTTARFFLLLTVLSGCARVPVEVRQAMEKQTRELQEIQLKYHEAVDILFAQIKKLQNFILVEKEKEFKRRYARGPKVVKLVDGMEAVIYNSEDGKPFSPSNNPDVDLIAVSTSVIISEWFMRQREEAETSRSKAKEEFMKLEDHIRIAQKINEAVTEYLDSLINLRGAQNELANALVRKIGMIPSSGPLQPLLVQLLVPETGELESQLRGKK